MKTLACAAAVLLVLLVGATCGYAESTSLRCLRCGEAAEARQLRLGLDVLLHYVPSAQHSIPLSTVEVHARPELPSTCCKAGHHLWVAGQTWKRGIFEHSGPDGTSFIAWR